VNGEKPGTFAYEIISPISKRSNLNRGAIKEIRSLLPGEELFELNNDIYARTFVDVEDDEHEIMQQLEELVYKADKLEEEYAKEDFNFWGK
jgi:hypothetical protein